MNDWQSPYLGRGALPRDLSGFEIEAFFTYSESERRIIHDERRWSALSHHALNDCGVLPARGDSIPVVGERIGAVGKEKIITDANE